MARIRMAVCGMVLSAATAAVVAGCSSHAAAAGAGAGAAYYLTSRGAEGIAQGDMSDVASRSRSVLQSMNIELSGDEGSVAGEEAEIHGKIAGGDKDVTVELERRSETETLVQVQVKDNALQYDKDMARQIVQQIVEGQSGGAAQGYETPSNQVAPTPSDTTAVPTEQVPAEPMPTPTPMDTSRSMTDTTGVMPTPDAMAPVDTTAAPVDTSSSTMQTPQPMSTDSSAAGTGTTTTTTPQR